MSRTSQLHEARRWLTTAGEDVAAATALLAAGHYPSSCFLFQQAAEKAVKALWYASDLDPWGHSVQKLLEDFGDRDRLSSFEDLRRAAIHLDRLYIPTRYPNGIPDLTPGQTYIQDDAEAARKHADRIITEVTRILGQMGS